MSHSPASLFLPCHPRGDPAEPLCYTRYIAGNESLDVDRIYFLILQEEGVKEALENLDLYEPWEPSTFSFFIIEHEPWDEFGIPVTSQIFHEPWNTTSNLTTQLLYEPWNQVADLSSNILLYESWDIFLNVNLDTELLYEDWES